MERKIKKHTSPPRNKPRRPDYTITDQSWIKKHLHQSVFGTIATTFENQPYATPRLYVYDEARNRIYFHGAKVGKLINNIQHNPEVCFNVSSFGRLLPHAEAFHFNIEYDSVTIFGKANMINSNSQIKIILQQLMRKYANHLQPTVDYQDVQNHEVKRTSIMEIIIEDWSGKQQKEDENFPGAYIFSPINE